MFTIATWQACSLTGLLEAMQELFSRDPPVYAKPRSISPQQQQTSPAQQFISSRSHDHVTQSTNSAVQPPLPPKPHAQVAHLNAQPSGASAPSPVSLSSPSGISSTPVQSGTQSPTLTVSHALNFLTFPVCMFSDERNILIYARACQDTAAVIY